RTAVVGDTIVREGIVGLAAPGLVVPVLAAGAVHVGRPLPAVDHHHVVALAPPAAAEIVDREVGAAVMTTSFGIKEEVIVLIGQVHLKVVALAARLAARILPVPPGVEAEFVLRQAVEGVVVDIEVPGAHVLIDALPTGRLVLYRDARPGGKRHGPVAVHR